MSVIQRPPKQGGATTYQNKVALGYTAILAAEVDADLDVIYAAWNGGADTANIADNSISSAKLQANSVGTRELVDGGIQTVDLGNLQVTTLKLADGAVQTAKLGDLQVTTGKLGDLQVTTGKLANGAVTAAKLDPAFLTAGGDLLGTYPNPTLRGVSSGGLWWTPRGELNATATAFDISANNAGSINYDTSKSGWFLRLNYTSDMFEIYRAPSGATQTYSRVFFIDGSTSRVNCFLADGTVTRPLVAVGTMIGNTAFVNSPTSVTTPTPGVWTTILTLPALAVRGPTGASTAVLLNVYPGISASAGPGGALVAQRLTRNGTSIMAVPYLLASAASTWTPLPAFSFYDKAPSGTTVTYAYQVYVQNASCAIIASGDASGGILAQEFD